MSDKASESVRLTSSTNSEVLLEETGQLARHSPPASMTTVGRASIWGFGGRVILMGANAVATPFLIRLLGPSRYGLWALLQTALSWLGIADLGMWSASTKFAAERHEAGDSQGESSVIWGALTITAVSGGAIAVATAFGAPFIVGRLFHANPALKEQGVTALRLVCVAVVAGALGSSVITPLQVRLRWDQLTTANVVGNLAAIAGAPVALLLVSGGVVTVAAVNVSAALLGLTLGALLAMRLLPAMRRPRLSKPTLNRLLHYGGALSVGSLVSIILYTAERFFLASHHSPRVVAYYAVAVTLATTLDTIPQQLVGPLIAGFGRLVAAGESARLRALYQRTLSGLLLTVLPAATLLVLIAHPFLSLWAGKDYGAHSSAAFLVLVLGGCFASLGWVPYTYLISTARTSLIAGAQIIEAVPYLPLAYVLSNRFGIIGAAASLSLLYVADCIVWFVVAKRRAGLCTSVLSERPDRAIMVLVGLAVAVIPLYLLTSGFPARFVEAAALGLVYLGALWCFVLTPRERQGLLHMVLPPIVNLVKA